MTRIVRCRAITETVEAMQFGPTPDDINAAIEFCAGVSDAKALLNPKTGEYLLLLDGPSVADVGDWLVRDAVGVLPYNTKEFAELYEPVP